MGVNLVQTAFSAALGQALIPLAEDPLLIWNYALVAILAFLGESTLLMARSNPRHSINAPANSVVYTGGIGFWFTWKDLDAKEDELNMIQATKFMGRKASVIQDVEKT